jgi:hypothetical protein
MLLLDRTGLINMEKNPKNRNSIVAYYLNLGIIPYRNKEIGVVIWSLRTANQRFKFRHVARNGVPAREHHGGDTVVFAFCA